MFFHSISSDQVEKEFDDKELLDFINKYNYVVLKTYINSFPDYINIRDVDNPDDVISYSDKLPGLNKIYKRKTQYDNDTYYIKPIKYLLTKDLIRPSKESLFCRCVHYSDSNNCSRGLEVIICYIALRDIQRDIKEKIIIEVPTLPDSIINQLKWI